VRACSTASTPACTVPDLLSLFFKNTKKYRRGDARQIPPKYAAVLIHLRLYVLWHKEPPTAVF
jgi:hypothetical protein